MTKAMKWLSVTMLLLAVFVSIALSGRDVLWLNGIGLAAFLMAALAFDGRPARPARPARPTYNNPYGEPQNWRAALH